MKALRNWNTKLLGFLKKIEGLHSWKYCILIGMTQGIFITATNCIFDPLLYDALNPPPNLGMRGLAACIMGLLLGNYRYVYIQYKDRIKKQKPFQQAMILGFLCSIVGGTMFILYFHLIRGFPIEPKMGIFGYLWWLLGGFLGGYIAYKVEKQ